MSSSELSCPYTSGLSFRLQYASKLEEEYKSLHSLSMQTHDHHLGLESFFSTAVRSNSPLWKNFNNRLRETRACAACIMVRRNCLNGSCRMRKVAIAVNTRPAVRSMFNSKQDSSVSTETNRGESHNRKIDIAAIYVSFVIHNRSISCASITWHQLHESCTN